MVGEPVTRVGVSRLHFPVTTLGPGQRAGIWLQGCSIHCPGCLSRDTWAPGTSTTPVSEVVGWAEDHASDGMTGITVSGGEPLDQAEALAALLADVRSRPRLAGLDVLLYTGYAFSAVSRRHQAVLALVDAVISGPYVESRPSRHRWMGSGNQVLTLLTQRARERFAEPAGRGSFRSAPTAGRSG